MFKLWKYCGFLNVNCFVMYWYEFFFFYFFNIKPKQLMNEYMLVNIAFLYCYIILLVIIENIFY